MKWLVLADQQLKLKDILFIEKNYLILTFAQLEASDVWHLCFKNNGMINVLLEIAAE